MRIWIYTTKKVEEYYKLDNDIELKRASDIKAKKGDIILIYRGHPHSNIKFIFKAKDDAYKDYSFRDDWEIAIDLFEKIEIPNPIRINEMNDDPILGKWNIVRKNFMGSFFEMPSKERKRLKDLIINKNPELTDVIENLWGNEEDTRSMTESEEVGYYDINAGRAHIVRDICYLISDNDNLSKSSLFTLLRKKVGDNDLYWRAYYQRSNKHNSPGYNLNSARTLSLLEKNRLKLTDLGKELVSNIEKDELFTYNYSIKVKKFFFKLALQNNSIKSAMRISREKGKLRFYTPICDRTNRAFWKKSIKGKRYLCEHDEFPECSGCGHDYFAHIKESSLPFETLEETGGKGFGFVFWMCSRVTPMHLTGTEPGYSGKHIYWDKEAEKELGDLVKMLNDNITEQIPRIWKITHGEPEKSGKYWPIYTKNGFIGIGWSKLKGDLREYRSQDELNKDLDKVYGKSKSQSAKIIWDFVNNIKIGDYVIANKGLKDVIGIGVITSDYIGPGDFDSLNLSEYPNLRKVDWKIIDDIEVPTSFDRKTVTELDGKRWNEIISSYARLNPDFKLKLIDYIYNEFKQNYLDTEEGQKHRQAYEKESNQVKNTYKDVANKIENDEDATDKILFGLVPHKGKSIVGFISNIKAFFEKTYEIKPEKFPDIAYNYFETIQTLIDNVNDPEIQENKLKEFADSEYSKGFGAGTLSPILYFINAEYPLINNKTVDTVSFLSKLIGEPIKIDMELKNYIQNTEVLKSFLEILAEYIPEISDYALFDIFCHWMCDKHLGYYAKGYPLPLLETRTKISEFDPVFLKPENIETKLKLAPKIKEEICGTLNSNKNIMLTGAPGTGKTNLAEDVCKIAEVREFTNGYVLTTATSDWTTFDTIGGYMPDESGKLIFEEGKFLQAIKEDKWLIIDEINRADIDKAFGQLFTVLSGQGVELPFKVDGKSVKIQPTEEINSYYDSETATYKVGKNWRILATMNIYDKDFLFEMSYAFMRRFTFIYIELPYEEVFIDLINEWGDGLDDGTLSNVSKLLRINPYREIGPAIFKDVVEYVAERKKIGSTDHILEDAVLSYIMPQFEGLEKPQILEIWKIFQDTFEDTDELKRRLEEISTIKLDEIK